MVFDKRVQTLTAALYEALATDDLGPISNIGYVELILETLQAHAFNFVALDVPAGVHTIAVQAMLETGTSSASATAKGAIGMGSTSIESVRMIKDEVVVID